MEKPASAENDHEFFQHMKQTLLYHQYLLRDEVRNRLFYEALSRVVTSDSNVLDIGSGSGIWAVAAAKLGARRVTAVESNAALIPVIISHAMENGVADRVNVVNGHSLSLDLKREYDVVVSETIGNDAFDEDIVATMVDARKRFLAPGGKLVPQKVALKIAPGSLEGEIDTPAGVPLTTNYLNQLVTNVTGKLAVKEKVELLGDPKKVCEIDLRECESDQSLSGLSAEWSLEDVSRANTLVLWAECGLVDGVVLDTWETLNWMPVVCRFRPFESGPGKLAFGLSVDARQYHWTVSANGGPSQAYTPVFAYTRLKIDSQRLAPAQDTTA